MYNSESFAGHATLFGKNTKKCVRYAVKGTRCKICDVAKKKECVQENMTAHVIGVALQKQWNQPWLVK